jgi:hypothetical protein
VLSIWFDRMPPAQRQPLINRAIAHIKGASRTRGAASDPAASSRVTLARFSRYASPQVTADLANAAMPGLLMDAATASHETQISAVDFSDLEGELRRVRLWMPLLSESKAQAAAGVIFDAWIEAELPMSEELGQSYADLASYLNTKDADQMASSVAKDITTGDSIADDEDWEAAGKILAVAVKRASRAARRTLTEDLLSALEKPRVQRPTGAFVTPLLALLSEEGADRGVARSARRASLALLKIIRADNEADAQRQAERGRLMYRVASYLPMSESHTLRLLALSMVVPQRNRFVDADLSGWIGELPREDLISMLKWPICRGAVRQAVLDKLAASGKTSNGDLWLFVFRNHGRALANSFESPARRPSIDAEMRKLSEHLAGPDPVLSALQW